MKQLLFSFLGLLFCVRTFADTSEYERRLQQICEFVDSEEVLSNHPFHAPLLKIMGVMVYYGQDVPQDRIKGASLIILGRADPYSRISFSRSLEEQILAELTPEEFELAKNLALSRSKARLARLLSQASQGIRTQHTPCSTTQNTPQRTPFGYITIDNDWDPMESNSRVYGPGTHDGNTGMLRSDYGEHVSRLGQIFR